MAKTALRLCRAGRCDHEPGRSHRHAALVLPRIKPADQGSQYASEDYQKALDARGITCSMSRKGDCYDNAAMESWFGTLKTELGETFETHAEGKRQLFDYIEVFYNQKRRHSALGYVSPGEFEREGRDPLKAVA
jgi:putative transposase